ncbi:MAG: C40 family peptidase [Desulfovibrionaceae bacterium]|nr:C40 family peptidase [Desulfovibrionaceae bacterium]
MLLAVSLSGCAPTRISGLPSTSSGSALGARVVRTASTQIGKPYRSGGQSPSKGFDCSGLIYWSFQQNGVTVPRVTTDQAKAGRPVSRGSLQPGDIIVFRTSSSPNGLHTGLYAGQGKFIHSPNRRSKVRMDSLSTPAWAKSFVTGRRIVAPVARR